MAASVYKMRRDDPSVYGDFRCLVLGESVTLSFDHLPDGSAEALDMLGVPLHRADLATHISGLDEYGDPSVGVVREIAWQRAARTDGLPVRSTLRGSEAVAIVMHPTHDRWGQPHIAQFSAAHYFVTLRGIRLVFGGGHEFGPADVVRRIDAAAERPSLLPMAEDKQHVRAVRRLLESAVGAPRNRVSRASRWTYYIEGGA